MFDIVLLSSKNILTDATIRSIKTFGIIYDNLIIINDSEEYIESIKRKKTSNDYVMFLSDDCLFVDYFDILSLKNLNHPEILCLVNCAPNVDIGITYRWKDYNDNPIYGCPTSLNKGNIFKRDIIYDFLTNKKDINTTNEYPFIKVNRRSILKILDEKISDYDWFKGKQINLNQFMFYNGEELISTKNHKLEWKK